MNSTTRLMGIIIGLGLLLAGSAQALDRYVWQEAATPESPYTNGWDKAANNIQDAVNAADDGDTIRVRPGTYTASLNPTNYPGTSPNVVYLNKPLILRSESGNPEDTIIDGENMNRCVAWNYSGATTAPFVLDGFTLVNGLANEKGGGILLAGSTHTRTIRNCLIRDNMVTNALEKYEGGGGMYAHAVPVVITNCTFRGNMVSNTVVSDGGGGGLFVAGLYALGATTVGQIDNCLFESNSVYNGGGGGLVLYSYSMNEIRNTSILRNTQWRDVATPETGGGGLQQKNTAKLSLWNCLIADNQANLAGSAIYNMKAGPLEMYNCTVSGNGGSLNPNYAAVHTRASTDNLLLVNSIVYDNTPKDFIIGGTDSYLDYSCFPTNDLNTQVFLGAGNITNAPSFVNAAVGNYQLNLSSPCLNVGTNQLDWMVGAKDLVGNPRIDRFVGTVDMGCYERIAQGTTILIR